MQTDELYFRAAASYFFGDAEQIESVGAGKEVLTVFLGFVGIYPHDEIAFEAQCLGEVGHIRGLVLAAEKYLVLGDFPMTGGGRDFLKQMLDASGVVFDGKGGFEDVAVAVADQGEVLALGVVEGDAENFSGISSTLEKGADECVLIAINGLVCFGFFHGTMEIPFWAFSKQPPKQSGELKPYGLARLLRTVWKWYQVLHCNKIAKNAFII